MKNQQSIIVNEFTIAKQLREIDPVELPAEPEFFDHLHDRIMKSVESKNIKPKPKLSKPWHFLERQSYLVGMEVNDSQDVLKNELRKLNK